MTIVKFEGQATTGGRLPPVGGICVDETGQPWMRVIVGNTGPTVNLPKDVCWGVYVGPSSGESTNSGVIYQFKMDENYRALNKVEIKEVR